MIIMASCIPTLGPLYEVIRGKRKWSSHQRYYNYKSSGNKMPLSSMDGQPKKSTLRSRDEADLFTTNIGTTKEGSQESILGPTETPKGAHPAHGIQRTDQVVVEYEMGAMGREGRPSW
ncbi:hypothetical protein BDV06DRAFT_46520 [Aspergillus oleicola]